MPAAWSSVRSWLRASRARWSSRPSSSPVASKSIGELLADTAPLVRNRIGGSLVVGQQCELEVEDDVLEGG